MNSAYLKVILKRITLLALLVFGVIAPTAWAEEAAPAPAPSSATAPASTNDAPKGAPGEASKATPADSAASPTAPAPSASAPAPVNLADAPMVPAPSMDDMQNMDDMAALIKKNSDAIGAAYLNHITQTLLPMVALISAIAGWISYGIVAHVIALMIAPLRAGLVRAVAYGAVQGIVISVLVVVLFFTAMPVVQYVISWGADGAITPFLLVFVLLLLVTGVSFIVVAALVYEIPFGRAILFGVMVFFTSGFVSGPVFYIVFTLFKPMLSQQTTAPVFDILAVKLVDENAAIMASIQDQREAIAKLKTEQETIQKDKVATEKALEAKKAKLTEAQKADSIAFSMLGQLVDDGKRPEAIAAYREFAASRTGEYAALAKSIADELEAEDAAKKAAAEKMRLDAEKAKVDAENKFQSRMANGEATISEIRTRLLGLSRDQVITMLGQPSERQADAFIYSRIRMIDPITRDRKTLMIRFQLGVVLNVMYAN